MPNKLEAIKKKCIEANPSIMDLVFGCEVKWLHRKGIIARTFTEHGWRMVQVNLYNKKPNTVSLRIEALEILGRDIRLADVLLAMGAKENWEDLIRGKNSWNLKNDSLDQQSPETIAFLYQLLCE